MIRHLLVLLFCAFSIAWSWDGGWDSGDIPSSAIKVSTDNFSTNLSSLDDTVQKALDTLDDLIAGGLVNWTDIGGLQSDINVGGFTNDAGYINNAYYSAGSGVSIGTTGVISNTGVLTEVDPKVGTLTDTKWCNSDGSQVICDQDTPSSSQWTTSGSDVYYSTGNVGIGTSTTAQKLYVSGNGYFSGNIGIGSAVPSQKLDVLGTIYAKAQTIFNSYNTGGSQLVSMGVAGSSPYHNTANI